MNNLVSLSSETILITEQKCIGDKSLKFDSKKMKEVKLNRT